MKARIIFLVMTLIVGISGLALTAAHAVDTCPPVHPGDWNVDYQIDNSFSGSGSGHIAITNNTHQHGPLDLGFGPGTYDGNVTCTSVEGTYTDPQHTVTFTGTLGDDGRDINGSFSSPSVGTGTFHLAITADSLSVAIGDASVSEGGQATGATFSARTAQAEAKAAIARNSTRTATFSIVLNEPAPRATRITYEVLDDTAVAGIDYVDDGHQHSVTIGKGRTQKDIIVKTITNGLHQDDRNFKVMIIDVTNGLEAYDNVAVGTIHDDD